MELIDIRKILETNRPDLLFRLSNVAHRLDVKTEDLILYLLEHEVVNGICYGSLVKELEAIRKDIKNKKK